MRTVSVFVVIVGLATIGAASAADVDYYGLIAQSANASEAKESGDTGAAEREARIDLTLARSRLELVLARKALRRHQIKDAAVRAQRVLNLLKELPREVDASEYELQAEGILARAAKAGVDVETLRRQVPDDHSYRPGKGIFDTGAVPGRDRQRDHYEGALRKAYSADAARLLTEADEARVVPAGDIAYPDDWPEKVAKRDKYAGGQIARSESWYDQDGHEWYVAVYDIYDLIYVPPDFQPTFCLDPVEDLRNTLDRHALRLGYGCFGGLYPWDLNMTMPLLRCFGGVDDYAWRGPKYSVERQEQIIEMIKAFTTKPTESKIIPLSP